eukprot:2167487-Pleurochrysis_carterae.AAC.1
MGTETKLFVACTSMRCTDNVPNNDKCHSVWKDSGCPVSAGRPWVMCQDDEVTYPSGRGKPTYTIAAAEKDMYTIQADQPNYKKMKCRDVFGGYWHNDARYIRSPEYSLPERYKTKVIKQGQLEVPVYCKHAFCGAKTTGYAPGGVPTQIFVGCSSMRCGDQSQNKKCDDALHSTQCPKTNAKTWIMCKDATGTYHADNATKPTATVDETLNRILGAKKLLPDLNSTSCLNLFGGSKSTNSRYIRDPAYKVLNSDKKSTTTVNGNTIK